MQVVMDVGLVALVSLAASFLLLAKLHQQLSLMIEGRIYQERSQNWPIGVHAKYRASPKELLLHVVSFGLLGITIGLLVYLELRFLPTLFVCTLTLLAFYLLAREIFRSFPLEEERNRTIFEENEKF